MFPYSRQPSLLGTVLAEGLMCVPLLCFHGRTFAVMMEKLFMLLHKMFINFVVIMLLVS